MTRRSALIQLHITVLIWGFTAILGKLISISALQLVWYRMFVAAVSLLGYIFWQKTTLRIGRKSILQLLGIGVIVAVHWLTFYGCIKSASIAIALVCLSATTFFVSLISPFIQKKKFSLAEVIFGIINIFGIALIFNFESQYTMGIIIGLISSLAAAIFSILNEKQVQNQEPSIISFYEMLGGFLIITPYILIFKPEITQNMGLSMQDFIILMILGTVCTSFAYLSGVKVMKQLSAYTVALTTNLEPIYGIILGYFIFKKSETMTLGFYIGGSIIILNVLGWAILQRRNQRKASAMNI